MKIHRIEFKKTKHLTALPDLTVLPFHLRVCGVTPGNRGGIRVTAVVII